MAGVIRAIKTAFSKYPVLANSVIYGTLFVGAELSQQLITKKVMPEKPEPLDIGIIEKYIFYGTCVQGPLLTTWYRWLDRQLVGTATKTVIKKVIIDQFLMTPPLYCLFFVAMSLMERKEDIFEECKAKFMPAFKTSCCFWIPAQSINFFLVPTAFRVVYVGSCSFIWINILCWIKRQEY